MDAALQEAKKFPRNIHAGICAKENSNETYDRICIARHRPRRHRVCADLASFGEGNLLHRLLQGEVRTNLLPERLHRELLPEQVTAQSK
jgi:hypothetical protein